MPTATKTRKTRDSKPSTPEPPPLRESDGGTACKWTESKLIHGEGDRHGHPFELMAWHREFLWRWFERGPRRYPALVVYRGSDRCGAWRFEDRDVGGAWRIWRCRARKGSGVIQLRWSTCDIARASAPNSCAAQATLGTLQCSPTLIDDRGRVGPPLPRADENRSRSLRGPPKRQDFGILA